MTAAATTPDDASLLRRFADTGDEEAFREIVSRHGPMVLGVCRRQLRDPHLAEDAFQQTLVALWRHAHRIDCEPTLVRWLHTTALRQARDIARLAHRRREHPAKQHLMDTQAADAGAGPTAADDVRRILDDELRALPERERVLLIMRHMEGRSRAECARSLGVPPGSIGDLLTRAGSALRARLTRRGVTGGTAIGIEVLVAEAPPLPAALVERTVARVCAYRPGAPVATGGVTATVKMGVAVLMVAGVVLPIAFAFGGTATPTPVAATTPSANVDLYAPARWQHDAGLAWELVTLPDGARAIRLGPATGGRARSRAHLDLERYLPASFRFSYRVQVFRVTDRRPAPDGRERPRESADREVWVDRSLTYRFDGTGYAITEVIDGRRRTVTDDLEFTSGSPFAFDFPGGAGLVIRDLELEWLQPGG